MGISSDHDEVLKDYYTFCIVNDDIPCEMHNSQIEPCGFPGQGHVLEGVLCVCSRRGCVTERTNV